MILWDLKCESCGEELRDFPFDKEKREAPVVHFDCGGQFSRTILRRGGSAVWHSTDTIVVFRSSTGEISYPARNDVPTPRDKERVEIRSLAELHSFEKAHGVRSYVNHYDKGTGRDFAYGEVHGSYDTTLDQIWKER